VSEQPRIVYAVSYGEYSDYGVHCLFTTRELAEAYGGADSVEEFELWDRQPAKFDYWEMHAYVDPDEVWWFGDSQQHAAVSKEPERTQLNESIHSLDHFALHVNETQPGRFFVKAEGADRERVKTAFEAAVAECRAKFVP
jgi:hypothetical protein